MRDYFARRGLDLPSPDSDAHLSCDALAAIFMAPSPDMPTDLLTSLYLFRELDTERAMDAIRDESARQGLDLALGAEATALDVVVRAWTLNRHLVETLHQRLELKRPRSFKCFATDAAPIPPFTGPTPEQIARLETRLNSFYEALMAALTLCKMRRCPPPLHSRSGMLTPRSTTGCLRLFRSWFPTTFSGNGNLLELPWISLTSAPDARPSAKTNAIGAMAKPPSIPKTRIIAQAKDYSV
jgi:hypothetical protein